jgi:hypothetical protein
MCKNPRKKILSGCAFSVSAFHFQDDSCYHTPDCCFFPGIRESSILLTILRERKNDFHSSTTQRSNPSLSPAPGLSPRRIDHRILPVLDHGKCPRLRSAAPSRRLLLCSYVSYKYPEHLGCWSAIPVLYCLHQYRPISRTPS